MEYTTIVGYCGYCEDRQLALLGFQSPEMFNTKEEMLKSLACHLVDFLHANERIPFENCMREMGGQTVDGSMWCDDGGWSMITDYEELISIPRSSVVYISHDFDRILFDATGLPDERSEEACPKCGGTGKICTSVQT